MRLRSSGPVAGEQPPVGIVHNPKRKRAISKPDTPNKRRAQSQLQSGFKSLISSVGSSDTNNQITAAIELRKLLSNFEYFRKIENANLVDRFEEFLLHGDSQDLRVEAARFLLGLFTLTMYTLDDSYQHKRMKILLKLLEFPDDDVTQQAVGLLGRVAVSSAGRDLVHNYDSVAHLLKLVVIPSMDSIHDKLPMLRAATSTLLAFCKSPSQNRFVEVSDPNAKCHVYQRVGIPIARHLENVKPAYEALCNLLSTDDEKVLSNVCSILSCLSDGRNYDSPVAINHNTCQQLVQLLNPDSSLSVVTPALRTLGNIARDDTQCEHILEFGVLSCLVSLLQRRLEEEEVCRIIVNITHGERKEIRVQAVIDAGLVTHLLSLVNTTKREDIRVMASIAISNVITGVTREKIRSLVSCIEALCNLLVFNHPNILTASLDGLERILKDGESKEGGENDYAKLIEEFGGSEKLKKLLDRCRLRNDRVFLMLKKYWPSKLWHTPKLKWCFS